METLALKARTASLLLEVTAVLPLCRKLETVVYMRVCVCVHVATL